MPSRRDIELIIFDCDGVLIDSEIIASREHTRVLNDDGFGISLAEIMERFTGISSADMYAVLEDEFGRKIPGDHHERVKRAVLDAYKTDLKPINGIHAAISQINSKICVASSSIPAKLEFGLKSTGLFDIFAPNIFSAVQVARGKPSPDLFLHAARTMQIDPVRCVVIEDSIAGTQAGVAADMTTIGFTGGSHCTFGHAERLLHAGAKTTLSDMRQLPDLLSKIASIDR